jgi:YggT family protein
VVLRIIADLIQFYIVILFVRIVLTWFPIDPWSPFAKVSRGLARVTDPVLVPVRKVVPPMRLGGAALDLSPIIVFVALEVIARIL